MGVYPSDCGFLGQGDFRADANKADATFGAKNEFQLVAVMECGPQSWVELGGVTLRDDRISVGLTVVKAMHVPKGPDPDGDCTEERNRHEQRFTLTFAVVTSGVDAHGTGRVHRLVPIPREVTDVLDSN